jgi:hypothetical protein
VNLEPMPCGLYSLGATVIVEDVTRSGESA